MDIIQSVLHKIDKKSKQTQIIVIKPKENLFDVADKVVVKLLTDAVSAFRRTGSKGYAVFQDNGVVYPFSSELNKYLSDEYDFLQLSISAMSILKEQMSKEALSTGGYILFSHYQVAGADYILIMQLKIKPGTGIDDLTLDLLENLNLDIDHLHEAARINIRDWRASAGKYISFVKKTANAQPTKYFRDFVGCDQFEDAKEHTEDLVSAVESYCADVGLGVDAVNSVKDKVFTYCEEKTKDGEVISLAGLSMRIDEEDPESFIRYLDDNELQVPDSFDPIRVAYKHLRRIGGKDKDLTINFNRSLLGKRVTYNKETGELVIKDLPRELKEELEG